MIVEAFLLLTVELGYHEASVKYSEPMTKASCYEMQRNLNAILISGRDHTSDATPLLESRCVPVSLVSTTSVNTTVLNQPINKVNIRK